MGLGSTNADIVFAEGDLGDGNASAGAACLRAAFLVGESVRREIQPNDSRSACTCELSVLEDQRERSTRAGSRSNAAASGLSGAAGQSASAGSATGVLPSTRETSTSKEKDETGEEVPGRVLGCE